MTVTAEELKAAGYAISEKVSQELIDRCVSDILEAYIIPILPDFDEEEIDAEVLKAIYCLTYLLLLARNVVKTRYGSRQKELDASKTVSTEEVLQLTLTADMFLEKLKAMDDAAEDPDIYDIARVYNYNSLTVY